MAPASSIRICVLQLPALLRRESGLSPGALSPSHSPLSLSSRDSQAVLERKQQQMVRVKEALTAAVSAYRKAAGVASSAQLPFVTEFQQTAFSSSPAPASSTSILAALSESLRASDAPTLPHEKREGSVAPLFDLLVLPEMWSTPYHASCFYAFSESLPAPCGSAQVTSGESEAALAQEKPAEAAETLAQLSPSFEFMKGLAKQLKVCVVGGSIVERREVGADGKEADENASGEKRKVELYNTCCVFDRNGAFIAKHRKLHLFDISILKADDPRGKGMIFRESDTLCAGTSLTSFPLAPFGNVGVGICYDLRFAEMALALTQQRQCRLLCYPGAFNKTTGPPHWSLLLRARALDNQVYVIGCSPAALPPSVSGEGEYPVYGHSTVIGPYGDVLAELGGAPGAIFASLERRHVDLFRKQVPTSVQKRFGEVYTQVTEVRGSGCMHQPPDKEV
ncbi:hydrolase, carbon-nitrogen family protein [Toxoplasma gondii ME49]|uniref:Hydrolase, carbon-nitrogen family protein n=3 Tax=Toxoplasma gondii TaxID=5811 RepID=S8F2F7_TOXGM|nr:hydrolase, carbon-nitrogen family protein [Toxoplasma gondii ME49]EPT27698.1 hydrolase, carbon-nitrogen family protein [Toxoplasma gondii ME49]|eukprot:XP_002368695.1 hydrolase, carbon-nitrogen family protein [Toxoplasma gondii ME49]